MSAMQRELAKSKMATKQRIDSEADDFPWPPGAWAEAERYYASGEWKKQPPTRYPIILTPDGPVSSAAELQRLAELESLPETLETSQVEWDGTELSKVTICYLTYAEKGKLKESVTAA
ncbi:hypothetical protein N658DRAFT_506100 [Parathielavia hyrcaniae]|uniref:Uncharacterized protein n=1 Tax=Parathielavia hyrcaniae TaxID=113614 RepID=A0AAN6T295_9PEZI|nr:hypothetical protein N658DRAFT_506100 [Parathielavia hyrcaniae]